MSRFFATMSTKETLRNSIGSAHQNLKVLNKNEQQSKQQDFVPFVCVQNL